MPTGVSVADHAPDYAPLGRFGLGTPQANPTVEPEFHILMPPGASLLAARLTSTSTDSLQRLRDYIEQLPALVGRFDTLKLRAYAFACTGSTYLVGRDAARRHLNAAAEALGCPVESAAEAILAALETLGLKRVAIAAPYPGKLGEASLAFWADQGLDIAAHTTIDIGTGDTRAIYGITSETALAALNALDLNGAEAVLLTGTGMPSLRVIAEAREALGVPILSSNYCLAWRLAQHIPGWQAAHADPLLDGWQHRLAATRLAMPEGAWAESGA
jgi:maleate isomerase